MLAEKIQNFTGIADVHSLKIANCWLIRCWLAEFLGHLTEGHPPCKRLDVGAGQPEWRGIIEAAHPSDWWSSPWWWTPPVVGIEATPQKKGEEKGAEEIKHLQWGSGSFLVSLTSHFPVMSSWFVPFGAKINVCCVSLYISFFKVQISPGNATVSLVQSFLYIGTPKKIETSDWSLVYIETYSTWKNKYISFGRVAILLCLTIGYP